MSGIYIHVPFCKSKCTYCDFASFPKEIGKTESYFACLYREIEGRGRQLKDKTFDTIYIGGGTPSVVPAKFICGAIRQVKKFFNLKKDLEITIEINPGTIDDQKVKEYLSVGINRFSVGLQTGFDDQLKQLNRIHTAKDFLICTKLLKGQNVSADVLLGIQGQTKDQLDKTLELCFAGGVKHISAYALTPEVGTPIYSDYLNGLLPSDDEVAELYDHLRGVLKEKGFNRYEVSNFALDGFESKHNLNYWKRGEYIGVGVSASSFIDNRRFTNTYSIDEYMNSIIFNKTPEISSEIIERKDAMFEFIMLALRTKYGVDKAKFNQTFNADFDKLYADVLSQKAEFLNDTSSHLTIKDEFLYVQNDIILAFMK